MADTTATSLGMASRVLSATPKVVTSACSLLVCILFGLCAAVAAVTAYRLLLHPLAGVPGPKLAAVSSVWYARHARDGALVLLLPALHAQYGPVVRIRPNEVIFDSPEAFRQIYSTCAVRRMRIEPSMGLVSEQIGSLANAQVTALASRSLTSTVRT